MKAVILAGGFGTRISEESSIKPKPMIEIGEKPVLWHIMKIYSSFGINDFVVCCGYKGYSIKEYFASYYLHGADVTFDLATQGVEIHHNDAEPWRITCVETGLSTMTGGRLRRVRRFLDEETFCMTYGDGVSDVDIRALSDFHRRQGTKATLTAVQPPGRFGAFTLTPKTPRFRISARNPSATARGSTADISCWNPRCSTTSTATTRCGSASRWSGMSREGQLSAYRTADSGSRWTHCATRTCLKNIGGVVRLPGKRGDPDRQPARTNHDIH